MGRTDRYRLADHQLTHLSVVTSTVTLRLTRIADVVRLWSFFRDGITYEARYLRYSHPLEVYRRILFTLVHRKPSTAWVGVTFQDGDLDSPIAFLISHESTPLHATTREFEVSMFYYRPGHKLAIRSSLQPTFDSFCRAEKVSQYYITTSSRSGSAARVFGDTWQGLVHSNTVFKRKIS